MSSGDVVSLIRRVANLSRILKPISEEQGANAAVALLLRPAGDDLKVLFVKRAENPADLWSGQIALPGGKRDVRDRDLKETIVRESTEEIGVDLLECCQFLGVLEALRSIPRPDMKILPFVVLVECRLLIDLNEEEVEDFSWISVKELADNRGTVNYGFGELPAYIVDDIVIWGLTYRILEMFFRVLECSHQD